MANDVLSGAINQFNFPELPNSRIILSAEVYTRLSADINLCAFSGNNELKYGNFFLYGKEKKINIIYFYILSKHDDYELSFREIEINTDKNGNELEFLNTGEYNNENDILAKYNLSDIDFSKVGHHGSDTSSSEKFINITNPKYSIISVGENNKYGHPKESVLNNLKNSYIYRTDIEGTTEIKINKKEYRIKICSP